MPKPMLPPPIEAYFKADRLGSMSIMECFAPNAVVKDEKHTYQGTKEIRGWREQVASKYSYTCEPLSLTQEGERFGVICHVEGNFPGSPVVLRFRFCTDSDKITSLEIL